MRGQTGAGGARARPDHRARKGGTRLHLKSTLRFLIPFTTSLDDMPEATPIHALRLSIGTPAQARRSRAVK